MKLPLGTAVQSLGLAIMIGGMLALGAVAAPTLFHTIPEYAGPAMAEIFTRYDKILLIGLGLTVVGEILRAASGACNCKAPVAILHHLALAALLALTLYTTLGVNADLYKMQQSGVVRGSGEQGEEFDKKHKTSESLYKFQLLAAVLVLVLTPFIPINTTLCTREDGQLVEDLPEHSLPHPSEYDDEVVDPNMS